MKDLAGRLTIVLTPKVRSVVFNFLEENPPTLSDQILTRWFDPDETPDNYVLDAAASESEAMMILTIARAIHATYE